MAMRKTAVPTATAVATLESGEMPADYRAVSIVMPDDCCEAVQALRGKRFLLSEMPILPLRDCARPWVCRCRLEQQPDRRQAGPRRRLDPAAGWRRDDRRLGFGRRIEDWRAAH